MIDYDKLKIAYELAEKTGTHYLVHTFKDPDEVVLVKRGVRNFYGINWGIIEGIFYSSDSLIKKIKELLQPKSKYKAGQTVYYVDNEDQIYCFNIYKVDKDHDNNYCYQSREMFEDHIHFLESQLYASKNELIDDQISYWKGFRDDE